MMMGMDVADMDTDMTTTGAVGIMKEDNPFKVSTIADQPQLLGIIPQQTYCYVVVPPLVRSGDSEKFPGYIGDFLF